MKHIIAWLAATLFFTYQYVLRVIPNVVIDDIMKNFSLSASVVGQVGGVYYIAYALAHIPIGFLLGKVGARKVIAIAALCTVAGTIPLAYSSSFWLLIFGRILVGIASSVGVLGLFSVIRSNFKEESFSFAFGLAVFVALVGAMYGGQPVSYSIAKFGWDVAFGIILCAGVLISAFAYLFINDTKPASKNTGVLQDLRKLFSFKKWLIISAIGGLMIAPMEGFADSWGTKFFSVAYPDLDPGFAAFLPSLLFLGLAIGSPIVGFLSSKFNAYYSILITCAAVMLVSFYMVLYTNLGAYALASSLLIVGIASSYQVIVICLASLLVPKQVANLATACSNMVMMTFGYFFHSIIGAFASNGISDPEIMRGAVSIIPYSLCIAICALILFQSLSERISRRSSKKESLD